MRLFRVPLRMCEWLGLKSRNFAALAMLMSKTKTRELVKQMSGLKMWAYGCGASALLMGVPMGLVAGVMLMAGSPMPMPTPREWAALAGMVLLLGTFMAVMAIAIDRKREKNRAMGIPDRP